MRVKSLLICAVVSGLFSQTSAFAQIPVPVPTPPRYTPTPTPTYAAPPTAPTLQVSCTLDYIFSDYMYRSPKDRRCSILVYFNSASRPGVVSSPVSCLIRAGQNSCAVALKYSDVRPALPSDATAVFAQTSPLYSEEFEEQRGCVNTIQRADIVRNASGAAVGVGALHQFKCHLYPN